MPGKRWPELEPPPELLDHFTTCFYLPETIARLRVKAEAGLLVAHEWRTSRGAVHPLYAAYGPRALDLMASEASYHRFAKTFARAVAKRPLRHSAGAYASYLIRQLLAAIDQRKEAAS